MLKRIILAGCLVQALGFAGFSQSGNNPSTAVKFEPDMLPHSPEAEQGITLVAELDGEILGFIDVRLERSEDLMHREMIYCHVSEIAVGGLYRGRGVGGRLMRAAEDWGRKMGAEFASLEFHTANKRAGVFYQERLGYRPAAITAIKKL